MLLLPPAKELVGSSHFLGPSVNVQVSHRLAGNALQQEKLPSTPTPTSLSSLLHSSAFVGLNLWHFYFNLQFYLILLMHLLLQFTVWVRPYRISHTSHSNLWQTSSTRAECPWSRIQSIFLRPYRSICSIYQHKQHYQHFLLD